MIAPHHGSGTEYPRGSPQLHNVICEQLMSETPTIPTGKPSRSQRALMEAAGLLRGPQRLFPLAWRLVSDECRTQTRQRTLYSYATTARQTEDALQALFKWILKAQRPDGGIAAYYSLLTGYSESYPEVTGYLVPTLYDLAHATQTSSARQAAEHAAAWLMSLQMPAGAFPAGLQGSTPQPSVFNTGQILQGLVRAHAETRSEQTLQAAATTGDWLITVLQDDGSWSGEAAYQGVAHTYYSMVAWALCELTRISGSPRYAVAADKNIDWVLRHFRPSAWVDGINLHGHPTYLHFIAYVIQGILECGILRQRDDAIQAAASSAWVLLRKFETNKFLYGTYEEDFHPGRRFSCLTGNAQMSCVWLRLYEITGDLRYLNAALKMNEFLKQSLPVRGGSGVRGGVAGSDPIWGAYQPLRYISWGAKFLADALMLEQRLMQKFEGGGCDS